MPAITTIQPRRGTASQWTTANPVLAQGETGFETDTRRTKRGDGTTAWNSLAYDGVQPRIDAVLDTGGRTSLSVNAAVTTPVNYLRLSNAATGASVALSVAGSDTDAGLTIAGKGTGRVSVTNLSAASPRLSTAILDGNGNAFLGISGPLSAVNYLNISNRQTGSSPFVQAAGTDANIDITIWPKGTGAIRPFADTGNDVKLTATGADTNHNFTFTSKGSGVVNINDGRGGIAKFIGQASPFNSFELSNGANGVAPMVAAVGTNTNIHLALKPKGTGTVQVVADTGLTPAVQATGVDANIPLSLRSKGTSAVVLANSSGAPSFAADMVTNQVNYLFAQPAAAGSGVTLTAAGSDTSIDLNIGPKGGGRIKLNGSSAADVTISAGVSSVVVSGSGGTTISRDNTGVITLARVTSAGLTAANDVQVGLVVDPTVNQPTGGVSGYRMISANPTETAVGTGERSLLWLGVGGSRRFSVDSDGVVRHRAFTTAGRPSASSVPAGSMIWNSTTKKPNYSDGTNWYDAAGVAA